MSDVLFLNGHPDCTVEGKSVVLAGGVDGNVSGKTNNIW